LGDEEPNLLRKKYFEKYEGRYDKRKSSEAARQDNEAYYERKGGKQWKKEYNRKYYAAA